MRKFVLIVLFVLSLNALFAQKKQEVEVIQEKNKTVELTIEFIESIAEARFIYSCPSGSFDEGDALIYVRDRAKAFTAERGFFFYTYIDKAVTRYDNVNNRATYTVHIKFLN